MRWLFFGASLGAYIVGLFKSVSEHQFAAEQWGLTFVFWGIAVIINKLDKLE